MSDEKEQDPNSPSPETMSSDSNNDDYFFPMNNKKLKLDELQKQAYYNVLHAFTAESLQVSNSRVLIIRGLIKEWNIDKETHTAFEEKLKTEPLVNFLREDSSESDENEDSLKFQEMLNIDPAKTQEENTKPSSTSMDSSPFPGWGNVSPESLVNKWINIKLSGEEDYIAFLIIEYDADKETHRLETVLSKQKLNDPCDWVDLRHIPAEDIIWQEGHLGIPVRTCFLKPGETLLHETATGAKRKQLNEVGETSSGT